MRMNQLCESMGERIWGCGKNKYPGLEMDKDLCRLNYKKEVGGAG